jgi:methyltransferase (TIGR00027 family)
MQDDKPSVTAYRVALRRAAHQVLDEPKVFDDPLALAIVGGEGETRRRSGEGKSRGRLARSMRAYMAMRSRYAEDRLAEAVARGARQYVVLGAGLDTFAYRNPYPADRLHVFEVDHPEDEVAGEDVPAERPHDEAPGEVGRAEEVGFHLCQDSSA